MVQTYGTGGQTVADIKNTLQTGINQALPGPTPTDYSPLQQATDTAAINRAQMVAQQQAALANPHAAPTTGGAPQLVSRDLDSIRNNQNSAIQQLQQAANGNVPSAAQLQSQQQTDRAAAQQFGMASALQGGMSPGNALRQASEGAASLQADQVNNGAVNRANEMANARQQLVSGIAGQRGQEQDLAGQNAGLIQQSNLANLNANLTTQGQNLQNNQALLGDVNQATGTQVSGAGALADANAKTAAATNAYNGSTAGMVSNITKSKLMPWNW